MDKVLVYNDLHTNGRLANQLFFIASSYSIAKRHGRKLAIPAWRYKEYFEWTDKIIEGTVPWAKTVLEPHFHYCEGEFSPDILPSRSSIGIKGYFQSERYFKQYEPEIREIFKFKSEFKQRVKQSVATIFDRAVIALHIRRGDYVNNPNYYNLPAQYYVLALEKFFPNWTTSANILIFSDDIEWCKIHLAGNNIYYSEGRNEIEDLCLMSQCQFFILSNSTYSWWAAWLSGKTDKIIRPTQLFTGLLKLEHPNTTDFWPDRWIAFNYEHQKLDLTDATFLIPAHYDHQDREDNLVRVIQHIKKNFNTNIIIGEQGGDRWKTGSGYEYMSFQDTVFHRTKMLNKMALKATTPIIINYDADIIIPTLQIIQAVKLCRADIGMAYPYDGRFVRLPKEIHNIDIGTLDVTKYPGGKHSDTKSVGGCIVFKKSEFIRGGMENEHFISYGPEDQERVKRFGILGINIRRIKGCLFHYDHYIGPNSSPENPHWDRNCQELQKISYLTRNRLHELIKTWPWMKQKGAISSPLS